MQIITFARGHGGTGCGVGFMYIVNLECIWLVAWTWERVWQTAYTSNCYDLNGLYPGLLDWATKEDSLFQQPTNAGERVCEAILPKSTLKKLPLHSKEDWVHALAISGPGFASEESLKHPSDLLEEPRPAVDLRRGFHYFCYWGSPSLLTVRTVSICTN